MRALLNNRLPLRATAGVLLIVMLFPLLLLNGGSNRTSKSELIPKAYALDVLSPPVKGKDCLTDLSCFNAPPVAPQSPTLDQSTTIAGAVTGEEEYVPPPVYTPPARPVYYGYNQFAFGNCTWGVANLVPIPWSGNANQWAYNASAMGYALGYSPRVGAIYVGADSALGHVALVTAVYANGNYQVEEMNYYANGGGFDRYDFRVITPGTVPLIAFILI